MKTEAEVRVTANCWKATKPRKVVTYRNGKDKETEKKPAHTLILPHVRLLTSRTLRQQICVVLSH